MPVKTRVTARRAEGVKCLELGTGAGVVIDPSTIEPEGQSKHGTCRSIKPSPEEFERMLNAIPNADRLKPVRCPLKKKKPGFENMAGKPREEDFKEVV